MSKLTQKTSFYQHDPDSLETKVLKERGQRLRSARKLANINVQLFSELVDMHSTTISHLEKLSNSTPGLSLRHAKKIIEAFESIGMVISLEWLMEGTGAPPYMLQRKQKPDPNYFHDYIDETIIAKRMQILCRNLKDDLENETRLLKIEDNAMEPLYKIGDYIIGLPIPEESWKSILNQPCLIELKSGTSIVRTLCLNSENKLTLVSTNLKTKVASKIISAPKIKTASQIIMHCPFGKGY